jgi:hypothetical protein
VQSFRFNTPSVVTLMVIVLLLDCEMSQPFSVTVPPPLTNSVIQGVTGDDASVQLLNVTDPPSFTIATVCPATVPPNEQLFTVMTVSEWLVNA